MTTHMDTNVSIGHKNSYKKYIVKILKKFELHGIGGEVENDLMDGLENFHELIQNHQNHEI